MRVFLTGANGWLGSAIAQELIGAGHSILGLARSAAGAVALHAAGVDPLLGTLDDLAALRGLIDECDGVVHTAFVLDFDDYERLSRQDRTAIALFGEIYAKSDRPIVVTSGVGSLADGETFTERARPPVMRAYPRASEQTAFALADRGLKASVVRPARSVHGLGEKHGFVPMLAALARHSGVSAYVGDGRAPWSAVHRSDAARVFRLAVERGAAGEAYHAVAENVPFARVAESIGRQTDVPTRSLTRAEAAAHFADLAAWVLGTDRADSAWTMRTLGWKPESPGLIADIDRPDYFA